jgi:hypothetical protein
VVLFVDLLVSNVFILNVSMDAPFKLNVEPSFPILLLDYVILVTEESVSLLMDVEKSNVVNLLLPAVDYSPRNKNLNGLNLDLLPPVVPVDVIVK